MTNYGFSLRCAATNFKDVGETISEAVESAEHVSIFAYNNSETIENLLFKLLKMVDMLQSEHVKKWKWKQLKQIGFT